MTAPAANVDIGSAFARADRAWCRDTNDEPIDAERHTYLVGYMRQTLGTPAAPDVAEAEQLRAAFAAERDQLRSQLADAQRQAETWEGEYERVVDQALVDAAEAAEQEPRHRHAWEWQPGLKRLPLPCSCGLPWPSDRPPGGGAS